MREMWKEKQRGDNSEYLQCEHVDGQRIQQNHQNIGKRHNGGHDLQRIVDMKEILCGVESVRITLG